MSRASHRSATPNACRKAIRRRSWEERCRRSTSGSAASGTIYELQKRLFLERVVLTYDFRLPPGPRTVEYALLAEELGFRAVWCPEVPAFCHDIWGTLARIAEKTKSIKFAPSVLIPSYRHPMAQASAIATLEQIAPGRLMVGFGTGFTGRAGMGKKPLSARILRRSGHCCTAMLPTSTAVSPRSSRPTAGCPIVRSTCQSTWQAKAPRPARSPTRLPTA